MVGFILAQQVSTSHFLNSFEIKAGKSWYGVSRDAAVAFVRYLSHCKSRQCTCLAVEHEQAKMMAWLLEASEE
nr:hypothetical protein [Tanacetum cinerariifolium]